MELYQFRKFAAVAELGHLTRAAERLHVSQPAVSAQIKALEDELGVTLFERVSSGMVLTSAGRKLSRRGKGARRGPSAAQPSSIHPGRGRRACPRRNGVRSRVHARRRVLAKALERIPSSKSRSTTK